MLVRGFHSYSSTIGIVDLPAFSSCVLILPVNYLTVCTGVVLSLPLDIPSGFLLYSEGFHRSSAKIYTYIFYIREKRIRIRICIDSKFCVGVLLFCLRGRNL